MKAIGNKLYTVCPGCGKIIRASGFLGGWHLCTLPEERGLYADQIRARYENNKKALEKA